MTTPHEYHPGDAVKILSDLWYAAHNPATRGVIAGGDGPIAPINSSGNFILVTVSDGVNAGQTLNYRFSEIAPLETKPAAPKVDELPTEPGLYVDKESEYWVLVPEEGWFYFEPGGTFKPVLPDEHAEIRRMHLPFVRFGDMLKDGGDRS